MGEFEMLLLASPAKIDSEHYDGVVSVKMPLKVFELLSTIEMLETNIQRRRKKKKQIPKSRDDSQKKVLLEAKAYLWIEME